VFPRCSREGHEEWLRANYPGLVCDGEAITGTIEFTAASRTENNQFVTLGNDLCDGNGAVVLVGSFNIRLEERTDKSTWHLPALFVDGIELIPERHFNQKDHSACLCSPLEEREFLEPELQLLFAGAVAVGRICSRINRYPGSVFENPRSGVCRRMCTGAFPVFEIGLGVNAEATMTWGLAAWTARKGSLL